MADESQLEIILKQGVAAWNKWRRKDIPVDLRGANLFEANLRDANLRGADTRGANLSGADLSGANFREANLSTSDLSRADLLGAKLYRANLHAANLSRVDLSRANLREANLSRVDLSRAGLQQADLNRADLGRAELSWANLSGANLSGADFSGTSFDETFLADVDLSKCKGLELISHRGPSPIDIRTLQRSDPLPLVFLRGVGLPDKLIEYLPSLLDQAIQLYSCFISYSAKDEEFVRRLHADLQDNGVRCWFAPEDMKIGAKILDTLDQAIRLRDKILLVLSEAAVGSTLIAFRAHLYYQRLNRFVNVGLESLIWD